MRDSKARAEIEELRWSSSSKEDSLRMELRHQSERIDELQKDLLVAQDHLRALYDHLGLRIEYVYKHIEIKRKDEP